MNNYLSLSNTLRPRQNSRHFTDDIFKCFVACRFQLNWIFPKGEPEYNPSLVQMRGYHRIDKCKLCFTWTRDGLVYLSIPNFNGCTGNFISRFIMAELTLIIHYVVNNGWKEIDIHGCYSQVNTKFCANLRVPEQSTNMTVSLPLVCMTSRVSWDDVTVLR